MPWEMEGKPNGQELRHWLDAERELKARDEDLPKTSSDDHHAGVVPESEDETRPAPTSSEAIPSQEAKPGDSSQESLPPRTSEMAHFF